MTRRVWLWIGFAAALVFFLAWLVSPVLTARALTQAAERGDAAALERHVDFPAFRASLRDALTARLTAEMRARGDQDALAGFGMMFGAALVSGAVDALVTPQGVAAMVRTGQAPGVTDGPAPAAEDAGGDDAARDPDRDDNRVRQSWAYRGLNAFAVDLYRQDRPDARLSLILERRGLFDWKLAAVTLPDPPGRD